MYLVFFSRLFQSKKRSREKEDMFLKSFGKKTCSSWNSLVEVTQNLSSGVATTSLLVVHDTGRGGEDDVTELAGRQETGNPLLDLVQLDVETGGDDTGLVDASNELDDDLAGAVVIDLLELANVA
jgi:hypothetical protein